MESNGTTITVLGPGAKIRATRSGARSGDALWIHVDELALVTGWELKPQGLCKDEACVPLPRSETTALLDGELVCASALWEQLGRPVLRDAAGSTWILGEGADDRARQLASLEAPDFTLPDIEGKLHSLSDFRGKKVFLATWASW